MNDLESHRGALPTSVANPLITQMKTLVYRREHIDVRSLTLQIGELERTITRYEEVGFTALASKIEDQLSPLLTDLERVDEQHRITQLMDAGYLIIDLPEWDGYLQRVRGEGYKLLPVKPSSPSTLFLSIPAKILKHGCTRSILCCLCSQRKKCMKMDCTALWMVQTQNFVSPVPEFVIDRVLEEKENFVQFDILFIAKKSEVLSLVRDFDTVVDPVLIGRWDVGEKYDYDTNRIDPVPSEQHAAVLAMWGNDLEEIDLVLALSQKDGG